MNETVTAEYLEGIRDGRATLRKLQSESPDTIAQDIRDEYESCKRTARTFDAQSPVGQMLRGERDFWRNQIKVMERASD